MLRCPLRGQSLLCCVRACAHAHALVSMAHTALAALSKGYAAGAAGASASVVLFVLLVLLVLALVLLRAPRPA